MIKRVTSFFLSATMVLAMLFMPNPTVLASTTDVNVNTTKTMTLYYTGQQTSGYAKFHTSGSYKLHNEGYNIWITNINLSTELIENSQLWEVDHLSTQYDSQQRYVKVLVRVRFIGDEYNGPIHGWQYDAVTYDV
jgi:hypothetical protein